MGVEMGVAPDVRRDVTCYACDAYSLCHVSVEWSETMNLTDLAFMSAAIAGLAGLRFGLPLAITWVIGKAANRLTHTA